MLTIATVAGLSGACRDNTPLAADARLDGLTDLAAAEQGVRDRGPSVDQRPRDQGATEAAPGSCTAAELAALEQRIAAALDVAAQNPAISTEPAFTLILERDDGRVLTHSAGGSTPNTAYASASTSKWVTAVVILDLVAAGKLGLDDTANSWLPTFWNETSVTLRHLLSFTSGFASEPICVDLPNADFVGCVQQIYSKNESTATPAGNTFHYSGSHMQVAGLMAIEAASAANWGEVFSAFQSKTGLFPTGAYDLPSAKNPRLAGGMHWSATEYHAFLKALYTGKLLTAPLRDELYADQRGNAAVSASPIINALGEDWSYGLGNWLECPTAKTPATYDCGAGTRNSSAGAYGAYPFIDRDDGFFGILARQGKLGSSSEGIAMLRAVEADVLRWAKNDCSGR